MKIKLISLSVAALFTSGVAQAMGPDVVQGSATNNFTMVSASNGLTGGTNDVTFTWDGTYRTAVVTDGSYNATLSSPTAFSGKKWTAHHVNVYGPGTYTFYTGCASGGVASTTYNPSCGSGATYVLTVPSGQVGAHMLFNWSTSTDIDVVILWDMNKSWAQTGTTSAFQGTANTVDTVWNGVSIDTNIDPDDYSGTKMIDGPFVGQSANFNVNGITAGVNPTLAASNPVTPANGSTVSASATTAYVVSFSKAMDAATLTSGLLSFSPSVTVGTPSEVGGSNGTQFSFPVALASGTSYTVSFNNSGVKDLTGMPLGTVSSKTFNTSALSVTGTSPANGAGGVSPGANTFSVTFSEPMNVGTVTTGYLTFDNGVGNPSSVADSGDGRTFNFAVNLAALTTYTVSFGSGPVDLTGGAVAARADVSFTTIAAPDVTPPTVSVRTPASASIDQSILPTIAVTFSEAMSPAVTASAITVAKVGGAAVPCTFTPDGTNTTFTCTISSILDFSSDYQVSVGTGSQDANGNSLAGVDAWTFTTRAAVTTLSGSGVTAQTDVGEVTSISSSATPPTGTPQTGVTYAPDYVSYVVSNIPSGTSTVNVMIAFKSSIVGKDLYKINAAGLYAKISESATLGSLDCVFQRVAGAGNENKAIITIKDNGSCDLDSTIGVISDPIVPATPDAVSGAAGATLSSGTGGGGGCAFDPNARFEGSMILALLASLGFLGARRKRKD